MLAAMVDEVGGGWYDYGVDPLWGVCKPERVGGLLTPGDWLPTVQ